MKVLLAVVLGISLIIAGCIESGVAIGTPTPAQSQQQQTELVSFKSWNDVNNFLEASQGNWAGGGFEKGLGMPAPQMMRADSSASAAESGGYSTTNVQMEGVDEADIVKNDGNYLYVIAENKVKIIKAYPASEMKVVSEIGFGADAYPSQIFVYGNKLVVFGSENAFWQPQPLPVEPTPQPTTAVPSQVSSTAVACTADAMLCPDGSSVSRVPPSCEFAPCPEVKPSPEATASVEPSPTDSGSEPVNREDLDKRMAYPYPYYQQASFARVYDISAKEKPVLVKSFALSGSYVQSRMIDGRVFIVSSENAYYGGPMPLYAEDGVLKQTSPVEINYFDYPDYNYNFVTVLGFNLDDLSEQESKKVLLMGYAQALFVSKDNAFLTQVIYDYQPYPTLKWSDYLPILEPYATADLKEKISAIDSSEASEWRKEALKVSQAQKFIEGMDENQRNAIYEKVDSAMQNMQDEMARRPYRQYSSQTVVHKFSLGKEINYVGKGIVPGTVLNQFSMDEYNGYFRIATTTDPGRSDVIFAVGESDVVSGPVREDSDLLKTKNHVFVLNGKMETVGKLTDLAPGERIYSTRFMGDRLYLVTFKKVDPLFAIDLSDPANPRVLGQLKIPGYSDYLHPYDENHVIGFGKSAIPAKAGEFGDGDFAWYQGLKLSLFDVSDVSAIKEVAKYEIGDRGSESYALHDHKAFLFAKNKNGLLVIPALEARINPAKYPQGIEPSAYGDYVFQGAYVFNLGVASGFALKGRVSHADPEAFEKAGYYWGGTDVQRSAYIENVLYTISNRFVKANDLTTLAALGSVEISPEYIDPYAEGVAAGD